VRKTAARITIISCGSRLIIANIATLFPGWLLRSASDHSDSYADMEIQELEAADLLENHEDYVRRRRFGTVVPLPPQGYAVR